MMRLSDMRLGTFWMEGHRGLSWSVVVLERIDVGRWSVLVSNSLGRQFITNWNDYEKSPITKELL
jgi:hypothetical protein